MSEVVDLLRDAPISDPFFRSEMARRLGVLPATIASIAALNDIDLSVSPRKRWRGGSKWGAGFRLPYLKTLLGMLKAAPDCFASLAMTGEPVTA